MKCYILRQIKSIQSVKAAIPGLVAYEFSQNRALISKCADSELSKKELSLVWYNALLKKYLEDEFFDF